MRKDDNWVILRIICALINYHSTFSVKFNSQNQNTNSGDKYCELSRFYLNLTFPMLVNLHLSKVIKSYVTDYHETSYLLVQTRADKQYCYIAGNFL